MARPKLTPLAASLRAMTKPDVPTFDRVGSRRHFAKKPAEPKPTKAKGVEESAAASSSLWQADAVTLLYQSLLVMPDPDEVLKRAGMRREGLEKMTYDDEIAQAIDTRREAAINTPWRLEGGKDINTEDDPRYKFIFDQLDKHSDNIFGGCWKSRLYGYSVVQTVYERMEGGIGIRWASEMPIKYYFPQRDGTVLYRPEQIGTPVPIMPDKYLVPIIMPTYSNPYGEALLSRLYWLWFFRTHGWQYWAQWLEQFGTPFLHGKTTNQRGNDPENPNTTSVDMLASLLDKSRRGSSLATDKDTEVTAIEVAGTGQQFKFFDDAVTRQISKVILGQNLTSSEGEHGGNRALGQVHEEVRQDKRRADVKVLKTCGQQLVNTLWRLNGWEGDAPRFVMENEKGLQADRAKRDAELTDKGVIVFTRDYLSDNYDLEDNDFFAPGEEGFTAAKGQAVVDPNADPANPPKPGAKPAKKKDAAPADDKAKKQAVEFLRNLFAREGGPRFTAEQQVIEDGVAFLTDALPAELLQNADILQCIREATSPADLADRLAIVMADADLNTFRVVMDKALFAASVIGFVHAEEHPAPPRAS